MRMEILPSIALLISHFSHTVIKCYRGVVNISFPVQDK